ncbi:MAG: hypothetical protein ACR2GY_04555 [Phycisphaerales bacterium]
MSSTTKFIPNGDLDFKTMAENFAGLILRDPQRFDVSQEDAETLRDAVAAYNKAFTQTRGSGRSPENTRGKNAARKSAEQIIRRLAHTIRANDKVEDGAKRELKLRMRSSKPKSQTCPQEPPLLSFVRALHEQHAAFPQHELKFSSLDYKSRPAGAVRLELFVDLVPPDEPLPMYPGAHVHSRPWYLRSYTRSPIVLVPPMMRVPMRVVYWGRWADAKGNVGPFSKTVSAWVEGGHYFTPKVALNGQGGHPKYVEIIEPKQLPGGGGDGERDDDDVVYGSDAVVSQVGQRSLEYHTMLVQAQRVSYEMQVALPRAAVCEALDAN